ncbi:MAG: M67 family metallopeptidase [Candidatus Dadabacteria bacterium]|nr:M67 family metallopeptidase [Candidatus Dadabacteria bacterium]
MVTITKSAYEGIIKHSESGYPYEICGVLIGNGCEIATFKECRNLNTERARDRYELDPLSFKEADDWARERDMNIMGIYHSHPDHPSLPSETDRMRAWPEWVYLIVSVNNRSFNNARAWVLNDPDSPFSEIQFEVNGT